MDKDFDYDAVKDSLQMSLIGEELEGHRPCLKVGIHTALVRLRKMEENPASGQSNWRLP